MAATRSMAGDARGARPRFVWRMTPLALMTGSSDGWKASPSRLPAAASIQATTDGSVDNAASPPAIAPRTSAAAARSAPTVASAPNRASSARTAGRCLNCSIDGMTPKSGIARLRNGRMDDCDCVNASAVQSRHPAILQYYVIDPVSSDPPKHRPLERFWPYADLPEQPTDEELAALDPDLHEALFGARLRPFSITIVFPALETPAFARALELARASAEFRETGSGDAHRYRARFWASDAASLREL